MASDPTSGRLIMFGGANGNASFNDTWAYDPVANAWTELKPSGPSPGERWGCAAAYDSSTGRLVVFGGEGPAGQFDDIWAYDPPANTWAELRPSGKSPASRTGASMVYDSSSHRVIIFGGCRIGNTEYFDDTWAFDPVVNAWTELEPSGALPSPRFFSPLVYAPSTGQVVMFGGGGPSAVFNDTWVFTP
jgi:N-acetylneuraminic acid mutarotase